jgi:hypothetical protein
MCMYAVGIFCNRINVKHLGMGSALNALIVLFYMMFKKFLRLIITKRELQVMLKVSPACLKTLIDTPGGHYTHLLSLIVTTLSW